MGNGNLGKALIAAILAAIPAAAQQPVPCSNDAITGFEATPCWTASGNNSSGTTVSATTNRTQGNAAFQVGNPPNMLKLMSYPLSNTAAALTGVGDAGASFYIDMLVASPQGNSVNSGYVQPYVTSASRGLSKVALPQVALNGYVPGKFSTLKFPIPDAVRKALAGATFADLTFEIDVNSPGKYTGPFVLDNLRVHDVQLIQNPTGQAPPPGYGGSVDLVVIGGTPADQGFDLGGVQIPNGFHLKMGIATGSSVQLQLGLDGVPAFTCQYGPDSSDVSNRSYIFTSCSGGNQPGDIVSANWVDLAILGDATHKIRAQLSVNALGDQRGQQLLPPMPTFWGDGDQCTPQPQAGQVVTTTQACTDQANQANQIITAYFNLVKNSNPPNNWIVAPVAEWATRKGDGTPVAGQTGPAPPPHDPPFSDGGDLNPGGTFDAYWNISGALTPTQYAGTDRDTTHFDATFSSHLVLFGEDVDVVDAKGVLDSDSGETTPTPKNASATAGFQLYIFGNQIINETFNPSGSFSKDYQWSDTLDLPPIQIWIFQITLGATAEAELKATGSASIQGADLVVTPSGSLGGHIAGGISLGIASGKVDAKINLIQLSIPISAQVKWVLDTSPKICALTLDGQLKGDLTIASGGGEVDLDATFGICPFCDTETEVLVKWGPLVSKTYNLFDATIDTSLFGLPASMCTFPVTVSITAPTPGSTLSSGFKYGLTGIGKPNDASLSYNTTYSWTLTPGTSTDTVSVILGSGTANEVVQFGSPTSGNTGSWTINLSATVSVTGAGGTVITSSGSATPVSITVTNLAAGVYVTDIVNNADGTISIPDGSGNFTVGNTNSSGLTINGLVVGAGGTLATTFTAAFRADLSVGGCSGATGSFAVSNASTTAPSGLWTGFGGGLGCTYQVTMSTTSGGSAYGSKSPIIYQSGVQ